MACDNGSVQLGAEVHVDPGACYECQSFPGTVTGPPFVVVGVGQLCLNFATDEAICELIDALALAAQELVKVTAACRVPAGAGVV